MGLRVVHTFDIVPLFGLQRIPAASTSPFVLFNYSPNEIDVFIVVDETVGGVDWVGQFSQFENF